MKCDEYDDFLAQMFPIPRPRHSHRPPHETITPTAPTRRLSHQTEAPVAPTRRLSHQTEAHAKPAS
jgi:hypothetical protein